MNPRIKSFFYAFSGLRTLFKEEPHARFHVFAGVCAIILGIFLNINIVEWISVILCIGAVLAAESFNSAIENLGDAITKDNNIHIGKAKDLGASGVLITAIMAAIIGGIIFLPKLFQLWS